MLCENEIVCPVINSGTEYFFPTTLNTQTIIVLFMLFASRFMYQLVTSFVSVIIRSQHSSAADDLNVVCGCETLTLISLSIIAALS